MCRALSVLVLVFCAGCQNEVGSPVDAPPVPGSPPGQGSPPPVQPVQPLPPPLPSPIWQEAPQSSALLPLTTGLLAVNRGASVAVVSEPDLNAVFAIDLAALTVRRIDATPGDRLGQVTVGDAGVAYVAARGSGQVAQIDLDTGTLSDRFDVCPSPQGLALSADERSLHVACRHGELVTLDAVTGDVQRTLALDQDLRDVIVREGGLVVSRFRKAEFIVLDDAGNELGRFDAGPGSAVAWRTVARSDGKLVVSHQQNTVGTLPSPFNVYYGSGCSGSISQPTVTVVDPNAALAAPAQEEAAANPSETTLPAPAVPEIVVNRLPLPASAGVVDVAVAPNGVTLAVSVPGNAFGFEHKPSVVDIETIEDPASVACPVLLKDLNPEPPAFAFPDVPVGVTFDSLGRKLVLLKGPARLRIDRVGEVLLDQTAAFDTGFVMFHMNTAQNTACVSCHPEGRDDGYTWEFSDFGLRRTQSLEGGVADLAPFHWDGLLETFAEFVDEVMVGRMGLTRRPSEAELDALAAWLHRVPPVTPAVVPDAEAALRGKALFESPAQQCAVCHIGPKLTNNLLFDVGTGGLFTTPPLVGLRARGPYLHDGCAETLRDRFGACGGGDKHGLTSHLSDAQISDLVAYLESL